MTNTRINEQNLIPDEASAAVTAGTRRETKEIYRLLRANGMISAWTSGDAVTGLMGDIVEDALLKYGIRSTCHTSTFTLNTKNVYHNTDGVPMTHEEVMNFLRRVHSK